MKPKVMIVLGSASDLKIAEKSVNILEELEIPYDIRVASAHRTHIKVNKLMEQSTAEGIEVFIAIAGLSAHLAGVMASKTHRPVIGVPVDVKLEGIDALLSSSQMPFPTPVATVGIDRGDNAAILAGEIIALNDENARKNISKLRQGYHSKIKEDELSLVENFNGKYYSKADLDLDYKIKTPLNTKKTNSVTVIGGSYRDKSIVNETTELLDEMKIDYDVNIISPIRDSKGFEDYIEKRKDSDVFLAVSGLSSHITGSIIALSEKPVIGIPTDVNLNGFDAILSMVNMPPGVPAGTLGLGNGKNGAIMAGEILAISDKKIEKELIKIKNNPIIKKWKYERFF